MALTDGDALDAALVGAKASALAQAARAGLPALEGVVLTTGFAAAVDAGTAVKDHPAVVAAFDAASYRGGPVIARSSSVVEDGSASSMAGQLDSVSGLDTHGELSAAIQTVLGSRARAGVPDTPIAVLVQRQIEPVVGGVMFGVDPVSGRSDRLVVAAVSGSVEPLVGGATRGSRWVLDRAGHLVESDRSDGPRLRRRDLARLARLAARAEAVFAGPQDIEWAVDRNGRLWLLQSRPVTTIVRGAPQGPVFGPGPVAETFPLPLTRLEEDLWLPPLRDAIRTSVNLAGTASRRAVSSTEAVLSVDGRVAVDLALVGEDARPGGLRQRLDPRPIGRRLRSAWRVGRLRAALPHLADHVLERTDADLRSVPRLDDLTDRQLLGLLHRSGDVLRAVHGHEILAGLLADSGSSPATGVGVALRVLAEARRAGLDDAEVVEEHPVVLALAPPRIGAKPLLPATDAEVGRSGPERVGGVLDRRAGGAPGKDAGAATSQRPNGGLRGRRPGHHPAGETCASAYPLGPSGPTDGGEPGAGAREALRLRARWVQELTARAAWALGGRLALAGSLPRQDLVRHLSLTELDAVVLGQAEPLPVIDGHTRPPTEPLPARFRLSDRGQVIAEAADGAAMSGTGAGGGVGLGPVTHDAVDPPHGSVLVTTTLTPGLGPLLHRLEGIVAETGSVLSHLAILARESGVATVVGFEGATSTLPEGAVVTVDGDTGRVTPDVGADQP